MTFEEYQKDIIKNLKALHIFKKQFKYTIDGLARALLDYENTLKEFEESGEGIVIEFTNKAGATNQTKNPLYLAIETLRQDILAYSRELGLTPASLKKIKESELNTKRKGFLETALKDAGK